MKTTKKALCTAAAAMIVYLCVGCNQFERDTYNTLAVSKAVIDKAGQQYNSGEIPQTACIQGLIINGRKAQQLGADDLLTYHNIVAAKGDPSAIEAAVIGDIATLTTNVTAIKSISASKPCGV